MAKDADSLLDVSWIASLIRRYCSLVEQPIYIAGNPEPINVMSAPWHAKADDQQYGAFVDRFYSQDPLAVFPLRQSPALKGVLYIPKLGPRPSESGGVSLYVGRMYVNDAAEYLPAGLRFMRGVVEANRLNLTASRSEVVKDTAFAEMQDILATLALDGLGRFLAEDSPRARAFLSQYDGVLKAEALGHHGLLSQVWRYLAFPSTLGGTPIGKASERGTASVVLYHLEHQAQRRSALDGWARRAQAWIIDASSPLNLAVLETLERAGLIRRHLVSYEVATLLTRDMIEDANERSTSTEPAVQQVRCAEAVRNDAIQRRTTLGVRRSDHPRGAGTGSGRHTNGSGVLRGQDY